MGVDGFSLGNLGINIDMTSAQMANQAERLAQKESEIIIKDVTKAAEDDGVKRREEEESDKNQFDGLFQDEKNGEEESENEEQSQSNLTAKDFENRDPKEFSIKVNAENGMIELFSNKEGRVLETISPDDMMALVSRLSNASGVLVNRKI